MNIFIFAVSLADVVNVALGVLIGLLSLLVLIVGHEFGHFLMARKSGVRVKEFGIGFPPRAKAWLVKPSKKSSKSKTKGLNFGIWKKLPKKDWKKDQEHLIFSLNFLPIGGFCAMDGESDDDVREGTFGSATYLQKTKILFGGVLANWLIAFIILTFLAWFGLPTALENQFTIASDETIALEEPVTIANIVENSPAADSNLEIGDGIIKARVQDSSESVTILQTSDIIEFNSAHAGQTIIYTVKHPIDILSTRPCGVGQTCKPTTATRKTLYRETDITVTLNSEATESSPLLGIEMSPSQTRSRYTWSAPIIGAGLTLQITGETFKGLGNMLVNLASGAVRQVSPDSATREEGREQVSSATNGVSGIVGILGGIFPNIITAGPAYTFLLIAIISISLACMNVLPIPALDGGRWLMITLARLRHKRLSKELEQKIIARAVIFLLILMALITILDIVRLVR